MFLIRSVFSLSIFFLSITSQYLFCPTAGSDSAVGTPQAYFGFPNTDNSTNKIANYAVMDGGFGLQRVPDGIDTIADLQKLTPLLGERGYSETDIRSIFGLNWQNFLQKSLPA